MKKSASSLVFIQGFGRDDLFTGIPPESLWGWRRNIGILVALLNRKGITWKERYAKHLSEVDEGADLFILRDWRYSQEEVYQFRKRYPDTPMISVAFKNPQYFEIGQRIGEERALFGITQPDVDGYLKDFESGLFLADRVVVRSRLNAALFAQLGHPKEKMVLLPHSPVWTLRNDYVCPAELPPSSKNPSEQRNGGFELLFVGGRFLKKGLFRLYQAFSSLGIPGKRLHLYNRTLYKYARGVAVDLPEYKLAQIKQMISDPAVYIHPPYRDVKGLVEAHSGIDLMVCPSLSDLGPNVLIEGYQLGTPILASTLCGAVSDLPKDSVRLVAAPCWWHIKENAGAYTERLLEEITRFYNEYRIDPQPHRPDVSFLIGEIVKTWENFLSEYL